MFAGALRAHNAELSKELRGRAAFEVDFLKKVTNPDSWETPGQAIELKLHTLKPEVIAACKAIALFEMNKGGFVVTVGSGHGWLIKNLGHGRWSAPVLLKVSQIGLGTSFGAAIQDCLLVINDEATIKHMLTESKFKLSGDVLLPLGAELKAGAPGSQVYTLTYGKMFLDFNLHGTEVSVDLEAMAKTYHASMDTVLSTPSEEFAPVYAALNEMVAKAAAGAAAGK